MSDVYSANRFSRIRENEAKAGAYYTDVSHCLDLRKLFIFPQDKEVCVLEPSIGDGSSVIACTGADTNPNIKIFGVEIRDEAAASVKENPYVEECLCADFTNGIIVSNNVFSFCFANPPYIEEHDTDTGGSVRLEKIFLDKIINYLKVGAVLVWIVPYARFVENAHVKTWMRNFSTEAIFRFRDDEFLKFKQIAVIGRKKSRNEVLASQVSDFLSKYTLESLPLVSPDLQPAIPVFPSEEADIKTFTTNIFDHEGAYEVVGNSLPEALCKHMSDRISVAPFMDGELLRPPIPLKKDLLYLLATSGHGQGIVGREENGDLHLQRGVATLVEDVRYNNDENEKGEGGTVTVTSRTQITMYIVENSGKITNLV